MPKTIDLGPVTTYAYAVDKGLYSGTEQQWASDLANVASNALIARNAATAAAASATAAEEAKDSITNNLVVVQETQPTSEDNRIWIESGAGEIHQMPTYGEFSNFKGGFTEAFTTNLVKGYYIAIGTGKSSSSTKYARTPLMVGRKNIISVIFNSVDYEYSAIYYGANGALDGTGFLSGYDYTYGVGERTLPLEAELFGLTFRRKDQAALTDADISNIAASITCTPNLLTDIADIEKLLEKTIDLTDRKHSGYIVTNVGIGSTVDIDPVASASYVNIVYQCKKNDEFTISGSGGKSPRLWCFTDNDYKVITCAAQDTRYDISTPYVVKATSDGYLIYNHNTTSTAESLLSVKTRMTGNTEEEISEIAKAVVNDNSVIKLSEKIFDLTTKKQVGSITTNVGIGNVVDTTPNDVSTWAYVIYPCHKNDEITIGGSGGSNARLWCLTDEDYKVLRVSGQDRVIDPAEPLVITVDADGYLIYNHNTSSQTGSYLTLKTHVGSHSDDEIIDLVRGVENEDIAKVQKIDSFIFSNDIRDTFELDSSILPEHPWDADNRTESNITTTQIYEQFDLIVAAHSDELTSEVIGTASDGETPIKVYRFIPKHLSTNYKILRPKIMVNSATHGWEKCGTETTLLLLKILFDHWDSDPLLEVLRWDVDWVFVPISNPWGFNHNSRKNANGIDLNRNYPFGWKHRTNSDASTYQGESALSEPESIAINALIELEKPDVGIDFHDFGNSTNRLNWVAARPGAFRGTSINSYHLAQVCLDKTNRHLAKRFSFLSSVDPTTLGKVTNGTYPIGLTSDAYYYHGAKFAYTFETCGLFTYEPDKKRFDDNHAIMCIETFVNFIAQNLQQLYRVMKTYNVVSTSDEDDSDPEEPDSDE